MDTDEDPDADGAVVWVVRLWHEPYQDGGVRARITHSPLTSTDGAGSMHTEAAASAADIEQSLHQFVVAFASHRQSMH